MVDILIPGYEITEKLGRGGMATVYRAMHTNLHREVAIKVMNPVSGPDTSYAERFVREARIAAHLSHPYIIQIYDVDTYKGLNYIVMEYVGSGELSQFTGRALDPEQLLRVMAQMTQALDYAHDRGYIHRDIKPSNILLRNDGSFVLADFGIARAAESSTQLTLTGSTIGTPSYMSPEQIQGRKLDGRADLYSLAIVFFKLLTGQLPYQADSAIGIAYKQISESIPILPESLKGYQDFIDHGLAKLPDDRFQTGAEMVAVLEAAQALESERTASVGKTRIAPKLTVAGRPKTDAPRLTPSRPSLAQAPLLGASAEVPEDPSRRITQQTRLGRRFRLGRWVAAAALLASLLGVLLVYTWWPEPQRELSLEDLRAMAAKLAAAYAALKDDRLRESAQQFSEVLAVDGQHAAARQGLAQVELMYIDAIEAALTAKDVDGSRRLLEEFNDFFPKSDDYQNLESRLQMTLVNMRSRAERAQRIEALLSKSARALAAGQYFKPSGDSAYDYLSQVRAIDAANETALAGLEKVIESTIAEIDASVQAGDYEKAHGALQNVRRIDRTHPLLLEAEKTLVEARARDIRERQLLEQEQRDKQARIAALLKKAGEQIRQGQLTEPEEASAYGSYMAVLGIDSENVAAIGGLDRIAALLLNGARESIAAEALGEAEKQLAQVAIVAPQHPAIAVQQQALQQARQAEEESKVREARIRELLAQADRRAGTGDASPAELATAKQMYQEVSNLDPDNEWAAAGLERLFGRHLARARDGIESAQFGAARADLAAAEELAPDSEAVAGLLASLTAAELASEKEAYAAKRAASEKKITDALARADSLYRAGRYVEPASGNAYDSYRQVLRLDASNRAAIAGIAKIASRYEQRAAEALQRDELTEARKNLATLKRVDSDAPALATLESKIAQREEQIANARRISEQLKMHTGKAYAALANSDLKSATRYYHQAATVSDQAPSVAQLKDDLVKRYGSASRAQISKKNYEDAVALAEGGLELAPGDQALEALKAEAEQAGKKKSKKFRMGGF